MKVIRSCVCALFVAMWFCTYMQNLSAFLIVIVSLVFLILFDGKRTLLILNQSIFHAKNLTNLLYKFSTSSRLEIIKPINSPLIDLVKPIIRHKALEKIKTKLSSNITTEIRTSGKVANPKILVEQSLAYTVFSFFIITPPAIVFGLYFETVFFYLLVVPLSFLLWPAVKLKMVRSERNATIEDEIAFFAVYSCVMQNVGRMIYDSTIQLIGRKVFPLIENEGRMLKRNVVLFGMDQITALNMLAISHPNTQFRNLLLGYVSIQKSGGNLNQYLERRCDEFFGETKFRFFRYAAHAEIIAEVTLILLTMLPLLLVMSSFLMSSESLLAITKISFILVPAITIMLILAISNIQPKTHNVVGFSKISVIASIVAGMAAFFALQQVWLVFAVTIFVAAFVNYVLVSRQFTEITMLERALPDFFRDITEYRKIGIAIPNAITRLSNERTYNWVFNSVLDTISSKIMHGASLTNAVSTVNVRSWYTRISFFVLEKIVESGGGTPQILEQITDFFSKINRAKSEMIGRVRVFSFVAYLSPLLMIWSVQAMKDMLEKIGPQYTSLMNGLQTNMTVSDEYLQLVNLLVVISSLCIGLIMSKLSYFTLKNTLVVSIILFVTIFSIYAIPFFPSLI